MGKEQEEQGEQLDLDAQRRVRTPDEMVYIMDT